LNIQVVINDRNYFAALYNKGIAFAFAGQYEKSLEWFDKSLDIDSKSLIALNNKGVVLSRLRRYKEATEHYDKALEIDPNYTFAWYNRACNKVKSGEIEIALIDLKKAIEIGALFI
jgi:tetratricopeptide (TPR) repeat protein